MQLKTVSRMSLKDWRDTRQFCLATIKEVYDIDYRADWHQDLDDMLGARNVYLPQNGGWFVIVKDEAGVVIACAGLRALSTRPNLYERFKARWNHPEKVGALWRSYIAADYRGKGLGTRMKHARIRAAGRLGYDTLYLHASKTNPVAIGFGRKFGFQVFDEDPDGTVHMESLLP